MGGPGRLARLVPPLLRAPDFRRFWIGQSISVLGDQITLLAMPLVAVLILHADAGQMGLLTAAGLLPNLILSLPAGVWLDRVRRRRRVMIVADLGRAVLVAAVPVAWALGWLTLELLFVVAFAAGCLAVLFDVLWATVFVSVAPRERYVEGNALLSGSRSLAWVIGPGVSGGFVQVFGAPLTLLLDALSYVASAASLRRIRAEEPPIEADQAGIRERLLAGLVFIARDPIMRPTLTAVGTINLFNLAFSALFVLYATSELGVSPGVLGLVLGTGAVGGVLGAVVAARIGRRIGLGPAYALGCLLFPVPLILVPLAGGAPPLVLATLFVAEFGAGLGVMILDINAGAIILARTPDRIRARATGAFRFVNYGIRPIGALMGGLLGEAIGVRPTLLVVSIAGSLGVLWLVGSPVLGLRELPEASGER